MHPYYYYYWAFHLLLLFFLWSNHIQTSHSFVAHPTSRRRRQGGGALRRMASPPQQDPPHHLVVVVGGGVSGLVAATTAAQQHNNANSNNSTAPRVVLLEAQDRVGGRVQTDVVVVNDDDDDDDAAVFRFDRGFAVFLEEYPMSQQLLDYDALDLRPFVPGAILQTEEWGRVRIADPLRQPSSLWDAIRFPIGTLRDRIQLARLVWHVRTHSIEQLFAEDETDTETALRNRWQLSDAMIDHFFRPFLQGIYLCALDQQSSRMFHFVLRMFFARGRRVSLPAHGMAAVAEQLQEQCIQAGVQVCTDTTVDAIEPQQQQQQQQPDETTALLRVSCNGGSKVYEDVSHVIVATESPVAHRLLQPILLKEDDNDHYQHPKEQQRQQRAIGCVYYSFRDEAPPIDEPILVLNGTGQGPVNNVCFPTVVSPHYAPAGTHLCSVTVLEEQLHAYGDDDRLDQAVRQQLSEWFSQSNCCNSNWKLERIYRLPNAQPAQYDGSSAARLSTLEPTCTSFLYHATKNGAATTIPLPPGILVCGDHTATASLQGALTSGVRAGEATRGAIVS